MEMNDIVRRLGLAGLLVLGMGCEANLNPFADVEAPFSVFGYLDAAADTQFVRVRAVRQPPAEVGERLDAVVTLEDVATGAVAAFRDSLVHFVQGPAHVFWSEAPVAHGATYRLTATRADGETTTATVTLPAAFPPPSLVLQPSQFTPAKYWAYVVRVEGVERVADVRVDFLLQGSEPPFETFRHTLSLLDRVHRQGDGAFEIGIAPYDVFFTGTFRRSCPLVLDAQVTVAATATDWPVLDGVDIETEVRPDLVSNVVNGFGYLGAVSIHTQPAESLQRHLAGLQQTCAYCADNPQDFSCRF